MVAQIRCGVAAMPWMALYVPDVGAESWVQVVPFQWISRA